MRFKDYVLSLALVAALIMAPMAGTQAMAADTTDWRMGSGKMGSFGYATAASVAKVAGKYSKNLRFSVSPTQGSTASMKLFGKGDVDSCYASNFQLWQALHNEGPFAKKPLQRKVYQTIYTYTAEYSVMTLKKRDDIKTISDLKGKKVFMYPAATGPHDLYKKVFKILGMVDQVKHVEISLMQAPDLLKSGVVDAVVTCSVAQLTPNAYTENLVTRSDLKIINFNAEEEEKLKKGGVVMVNYDPKAVFGKKLGVDAVICPSIVFGYQTGPNMSADNVYNFVKSLMEHTGELVKVSKGFKGMQKGGLEFQTAVINSIPDVPVHAGLARYLKEKGVWNDAWKVGADK